LTIRYSTDLLDVDWDALRRDLIADDFHNGRTSRQLRASFENSNHVVMAWQSERVIGSARMLSDGIGNAYVVDVWTLSNHRNHGVGNAMMRLLIDAVPGQHIYLQSDDAVAFYQKLGFKEQPVGLSRISGDYLQQPL
jgi:ribosomal protein S18 acetylase RimI-like enzyme